jgi:hypothetical protein
VSRLQLMRRSLGGNTSGMGLSMLFDTTLERAVTTLPQSSGDDLLGFQIDADAALGEEDLLREATVRRTEDPRCRLVIEGVLSDQAGTLAQVEDALWRIWRSIAYEEFQATSLKRGPAAAELRFVTAATGLCVTGVIRVHGPHFERLFRKRR